MCVLGESEFICNDSLFKVFASDCESAGWLFIYRETSELIKNTDGGEGAEGEEGRDVRERRRMKRGELESVAEEERKD